MGYTEPVSEDNEMITSYFPLYLFYEFLENFKRKVLVAPLGNYVQQQLFSEFHLTLRN